MDYTTEVTLEEIMIAYNNQPTYSAYGEYITVEEELDFN